MNILKAFFGTSRYVSRTDTTPDSPNADPSDIWNFTDPDARDRYANQGRLEELERDIQYEVMRAGAWEAEEIEYKHEIRRLLQAGVITDKGSYWYASPFPTVYRAVRSGSLSVGGREFRFRSGDDIVFRCRMARDANPDLKGPVLVARLQPTDKAMLCSQMGGAMKGM